MTVYAVQWTTATPAGTVVTAGLSVHDTEDEARSAARSRQAARCRAVWFVMGNHEDGEA